jgi:hypothetical protein
MSGKIRITALVLLLAGLLAPAAHAIPRGAFPVTDTDGLTADLWNWLNRLTAIWEKEGSQMDPNGKPQSVPPPSSTTEAGSDMDPNG